VEWFDRLRPGPDDELLLITMRCIGGDRRWIRLEARGRRHERLIERAVEVPSLSR
jgi:hypothetical protein